MKALKPEDFVVTDKGVLPIKELIKGCKLKTTTEEFVTVLSITEPKKAQSM